MKPQHTPSPRILVGIPVYNEQKYVEPVLDEVARYADDVLVIDDGSTDLTPLKLARQPVEVIRHAENRGYGRSMQDMLRWAEFDGFDWLVTMDCDEQHEPAAIPRFVAAIRADAGDVISGSRYLKMHDDDHDPPQDRREINGTITDELNTRLGMRITDAFCGFKAYRVAACRRLDLDVDGYEFPMQFWVQAAAADLRVHEIPVRLIYNDPNRSFGGPLDDADRRLAHYRCTMLTEIARLADRLPDEATAGLPPLTCGAAGPVRNVLDDLTIDFSGADAPASSPDADLLGRPWSHWRRDARGELGLPVDRSIIATGHQTLLWHPGILAKYLAVEAAAAASGWARANLIVDQHAEGFGSYEIPVRETGGELAVRSVRLGDERPGVPMALHAPVDPAPPPAAWQPALPSVGRGVEAIHAAVAMHRDAPDAACQMGSALADLMARWVAPMPDVTASGLLGTSLAEAILRRMADDPHACAAAYNDAVAAVPEARIGPLLVRDDWVEVPLWRLRDDGRRMRAYDADVQRALEDPSAPRLMPRALLLTALVRLAMADLFVHGTGGALYDRAMERWIESWLGVTPAPIAVVSATVRLPLEPTPGGDLDHARSAYRWAWHDPEGDAPGSVKRLALEAINAAPRRSSERRGRFFRMHRELERLREQHAAMLVARSSALDAATLAARETPVANRRTWAFPLYEVEAIDELATAIKQRV